MVALRQRALWICFRVKEHRRVGSGRTENQHPGVFIAVSKKGELGLLLPGGPVVCGVSALLGVGASRKRKQPTRAARRSRRAGGRGYLMTKSGWYLLVAPRPCTGSGCEHHSAPTTWHWGHHHKLRLLYCTNLGLHLAHSLAAHHFHHPWWEHTGSLGLAPRWKEGTEGIAQLFPRHVPLRCGVSEPLDHGTEGGKKQGVSCSTN